MKINSTEHIQAIEDFKKNIAAWSCSPKEDKWLSKAYAKDRKDMRKVLTQFVKGNWEKTLELGRGLDTIVRDHIPDSVWTPLILMEDASYGRC